MNIRALTSGCAILALISGIVTVHLWRELHAQREQVEGLRARLAEPASRATPAMAPRIEVTANATTTAPATTRQDKPAAPAPDRMAEILQKSRITEQELMKDPEYRKAREAMQRASIERMNPGLVEELGLSKEEADRFFDLMTAQQTAMSAQMAPFDEQTVPDPAAMAEVMRTRQAMQRQQADEVRALLGETKYTQWQEYQPTRSGRMQASNYANTLAQAGLPLDSAQLKSVVTAVVGEQKSVQQDLRTLASTLGRGASPAQIQEAINNRQTESTRRILEATAPHLSAQQLSALRTQFEQQEAVNRASARARTLNTSPPATP